MKNSRTGWVEGDELALEAAELLREEEVALAMLGKFVGAYGLMRVGEVVTDRGGGRREEGVVSGEERYRIEGDCIDEELEGGGEFGAVGEVGEAGPGNGEEWRRVELADPGFNLRNLSISARNWVHS